MIVHKSDKQYDIPENVLSSYEVKQKPSYDRMECLRGEWKPDDKQLGTKYCFIGNDGIISGIWQVMPGLRDNTGHYVYFPTIDLAKEYLLIAKGEWLPKVGDEYCACVRGSLSHSWSEILTRNKCSVVFDDLSKYIYFPSFKQMESFIAKRKNTLHGKTGTLTIDNQTYAVTFK